MPNKRLGGPLAQRVEGGLMQGLEPRDWDPQEARAEQALTRTSPWLAVLLVLGVAIVVIIVLILFTDFVAPVLNFVGDWIKNGP
jgi:hypothetical protein